MRVSFFLLSLFFASACLGGDAVIELFAAASQGRVTQVKSILARGVDVNARTANGRTALMGAAFFGNERIVRLLMGYGADVNAADDRGITPLMDAVSGGWIEVVRLLVGAGADINASDKNGRSVLTKAQQKGDTALLTLLEKAGTQPPSKEDKDKDDTPKERGQSPPGGKESNAKDVQGQPDNAGAVQEK